MPNKRRFFIYSILFLAISLLIMMIFPMSLLFGTILSLCILLSVTFLKLKGGKTWEDNAK